MRGAQGGSAEGGRGPRAEVLLEPRSARAAERAWGGLGHRAHPAAAVARAQRPAGENTKRHTEAHSPHLLWVLSILNLNQKNRC